MDKKMNLEAFKKMQGSIKNNMNPTALLGGMLKNATPKIIQNFDKMEQLIEDGGLRRKEEDKIAMVIVKDGDEIKVNVCPLTLNKETMTMEMGKPVKSTGLDGLASLFQG